MMALFRSLLVSHSLFYNIVHKLKALFLVLKNAEGSASKSAIYKGDTEKLNDIGKLFECSQNLEKIQFNISYYTRVRFTITKSNELKVAIGPINRADAFFKMKCSHPDIGKLSKIFFAGHPKFTSKLVSFCI